MRIIVALAIFSQWSGNGLVSYYLNLILETVGVDAAGTKTLINGILQIFNFGMAVGSAFLVDRVGRRKLFLISNTGMLVAFIVWTVTSAVFQETGLKGAANATVVMIFIYYGFYDIAYTPLLVMYAVEILPFRIRAKGFAVMSFVMALALIFQQYVNPVALDHLGWKYYLFYVGMLAFELVFVFFYLWETKGRTLEQTAVLFDGDDFGTEGPSDIFVGEVSVRRTPLSPVDREIATSTPSSGRRVGADDKLSDVFEMEEPQSVWKPAYIRDRGIKSWNGT